MEEAPVVPVRGRIRPRNRIMNRASTACSVGRTRSLSFIAALCVASLPFAVAVLPRQAPTPSPTLRTLAKARGITIGAAVPARLLSDRQYTTVLAPALSQPE